MPVAGPTCGEAVTLAGRLRADVARSRTLVTSLAVKGDLLSFFQGIEFHRLALAAVKEHFVLVMSSDEAEPTIS